MVKPSRFFERLTRAEPQNAEAWFNLGRCEYEQRRYGKARASFEKARQRRPSEAATLGLAAASLMDGKVDDAQRLIRECEQKYGVSAASLQVRGDIAYFSGDPSGALALYRQSLAKNPAQSEIQQRVKDLEYFLTSTG